MNYVISDIHGQYEKYRAMLAEISFRSTDTLYVLGDMIDRGPDGCKILLDMMGRPNVFPLLGNHEFTAAICLPLLMEGVTEQSLAALDNMQLVALNEWIINGGSSTLRELKQLKQTEREDILEYIREMELYMEVTAGRRDFVLVHAGLDHFSPTKPLDKYELQDFLFDRPSLNAVFFEDRYLIHGHTPTRVLFQEAGEPPEDKIIRRGKKIAIDCGAAFGGRLGCLCLDTLEEFYV